MKKGKSVCKEKYDGLLSISEHIFSEVDPYHGLPSGNCIKCGKSYFIYRQELRKEYLEAKL